jgi:hypothetical protein
MIRRITFYNVIHATVTQEVLFCEFKLFMYSFYYFFFFFFLLPLTDVCMYVYACVSVFVCPHCLNSEAL